MNSFESIKAVLERKRYPGIMVLTFGDTNLTIAKGMGDYLVVLVSELTEIPEADYVVQSKDINNSIELFKPNIVIAPKGYIGKIKGRKSSELDDIYFL